MELLLGNTEPQASLEKQLNYPYCHPLTISSSWPRQKVLPNIWQVKGSAVLSGS